MLTGFAVYMLYQQYCPWHFVLTAGPFWGILVSTCTFLRPAFYHMYLSEACLLTQFGCHYLFWFSFSEKQYSKNLYGMIENILLTVIFLFRYTVATLWMSCAYHVSVDRTSFSCIASSLTKVSFPWWYSVLMKHKVHFFGHVFTLFIHWFIDSCIRTLHSFLHYRLSPKTLFLTFLELFVSFFFGLSFITTGSRLKTLWTFSLLIAYTWSANWNMVLITVFSKLFQVHTLS